MLINLTAVSGFCCIQKKVGSVWARTTLSQILLKIPGRDKNAGCKPCNCWKDRLDLILT